MNLKKKISLVKNLPLWFLLQQQYKNIKKKKEGKPSSAWHLLVFYFHFFPQELQITPVARNGFFFLKKNHHQPYVTEKELAFISQSSDFSLINSSSRTKWPHSIYFFPQGCLDMHEVLISTFSNFSFLIFFFPFHINSIERNAIVFLQ